MKYIEAPTRFDEVTDLPTIFFGGGITNCKDWQRDLVEEIEHLDCVVYNPRRKSFDIKDPTQSEIQIRWEYNYLNAADIVIFYFSSETLCPITLFELGARLEANQSGHNQSIYIYCEPEYQRKFDVEYQIKLAQESYISYQESLYSFYKPNDPNYPQLASAMEAMKREGPQKYGYDVTCFDNYDKFVVTL